MSEITNLFPFIISTDDEQFLNFAGTWKTSVYTGGGGGSYSARDMGGVGGDLGSGGGGTITMECLESARVYVIAGPR